MKNIQTCFVLSCFSIFQGCSAPKPPMPTGELVDINTTVPYEINNSLHPVVPKNIQTPYIGISDPSVKKQASNVEVGGINSPVTNAGVNRGSLSSSVLFNEKIQSTNSKSAVITGSANAAKCFACENSKEAVRSNVSQVAKPVSKPKPIIPIYHYNIFENESIYSALQRWSKNKGLDGVVTDTSDSLTNRLYRTIKTNDSTSFDLSMNHLSDALEKENKDYKIWYTIDRYNHKLIVDDIGDRVDVHLFPIKKGTLEENAIRLAKDMNLNADSSSWLRTTPQYKIVANSFQVVSGDVIRSFSDLFKGYNVQAQIDQTTNTVYFTKLNK